MPRTFTTMALGRSAIRALFTQPYEKMSTNTQRLVDALEYLYKRDTSDHPESVLLPEAIGNLITIKSKQPTTFSQYLLDNPPDNTLMSDHYEMTFFNGLFETEIADEYQRALAEDIWKFYANYKRCTKWLERYLGLKEAQKHDSILADRDSSDEVDSLDKFEDSGSAYYHDVGYMSGDEEVGVYESFYKIKRKPIIFNERGVDIIRMLEDYGLLNPESRNYGTELYLLFKQALDEGLSETLLDLADLVKERP